MSFGDLMLKFSSHIEDSLLFVNLRQLGGSIRGREEFGTSNPRDPAIGPSNGRVMNLQKSGVGSSKKTVLRGQDT